MPRSEKARSRPASGKDKKKEKDKAPKTKRDAAAKGPTGKKRPVLIEEDEKLCPGNLREKEWNLLVSQEEGELIAHEIVCEIVANAAQGVYDAVIQQDVTPYTLEKTKEEIVNVVQMLFIRRDPGEDNPLEDPEWLPDEEPEPPPIDAWARGALPVVIRQVPPMTPSVMSFSSLGGTRRRTRTQTSSRASVAGSPAVTASGRPQSANIPNPTKEQGSMKLAAAVRQAQQDDEAELQERIKTLQRHTPTASAAAEAAVKARAAKRIVKEEAFQEVRKEQEKMFQKLKGKDFTFDHEGRVLPVKKVVGDTLPSHRVNLVVQVAPDESEVKGKQRRKPGSRGSSRPGTSEAPQSRPGTSGTTQSAQQPEKKVDDRGIKAGPVVAEQLMKMTPGVTFKAGERVRQGPKRKPDPRHLSRSEYDQMLGQKYEVRPLARTVLNQESAVLISESIPIVSPRVNATRDGVYLPAIT